MNRIFPELTPETQRRLTALNQLAKKDHEYFDDPGCPYNKELIDVLKRMVYDANVLSMKGVEEKIELFSKDMPLDEATDVVLEEIQSTIEEMKGIEIALKGEAVEPVDRLNFYKAKTQMLEKWSGLKERIYNMKQMADFQKTVIGFMEEVLEKDQQQKFKNRIKDLVEGN